MLDMCKKYAGLNVLPRVVPVTDSVQLDTSGREQTFRYGASFHHIPLVFIEPIRGVSVEIVRKETRQVVLRLASNTPGRFEICLLVVDSSVAV